MHVALLLLLFLTKTTRKLVPAVRAKFHSTPKFLIFFAASFSFPVLQFCFYHRRPAQVELNRKLSLVANRCIVFERQRLGQSPGVFLTFPLNNSEQTKRFRYQPEQRGPPCARRRVVLVVGAVGGVD
jgi:hypothetical protein